MALPQKTGKNRLNSGYRGYHRASSVRRTAKSYQAKIFVGTVRLTPSRITDLRSSPMAGARTGRAGYGTQRRVRSRSH